MNSTVHQLCQTISRNPSQINLIDKALALSLLPPNIEELNIILKLLEALSKQNSIQHFVQNKIKAIFITMLENSQKQQNNGTMELIQKCYQISQQPNTLVQEFLEFVAKKKVDWTSAWPGNLLSGLFESINNRISSKQQIEWTLAVEIILKLPDFHEITISTDLQPTFKKNFQQLILNTLDSEQCPPQLVQTLYHGLGVKVLSKMTQPLALSNHCLHRFAQNPEIQIEVLSCLFLLVGKYGLELQQFYPKLQTLIKYRNNSLSIYQLPNSRRFFKLLEASMRSSKVPFKTVSNFAKILVKQLPGQQGQFAFWALSFLVNLTKKHRKLLDELPLLPQLQALRHHHNNKIRSLVGELSKNLNKVDYLQIDDFTKVSLASLAQKKLKSAINSLENDELEFKIPPYQQQF